ncbi:AL21 [Scenedesmus sp. PABB004]|nr:AL21 [Scenedesmus sp. PABB004]
MLSGGPVKPKAATSSSLLLSWILNNEQLGMKPYQQRPTAVQRCAPPARAPRRVLCGATKAYQAPSTATGANELQALARVSSIVPDTLMLSGGPVKPKAATSSSLLLSWILNNEQLGMKPYQNAIAASLNYDKCLAAKGDARLSCQLDKALTNVGALLSTEVEGRVCTEVDPRLAKDTGAMVAKAQALVALYAEMGVPTSKLILRVPGTWEGIQAAAAIEEQGVATQVFHVYSFIQGVAAAQAGVSVVQPNVGRTRDFYNKNPGIIRDPHGPREDSGASSRVDPGQRLASQLYTYCKKFHPKTAVMASGLRTKDDALALAGCDYLVLTAKVMSDLEASPTLAGYNSGLSAAGGADDDDDADGVSRPLSPSAAAAADMADVGAVSAERFEAELGPAGRELLGAGLAGLVRDVETVLPYFKSMAKGSDSPEHTQGAGGARGPLQARVRRLANASVMVLLIAAFVAVAALAAVLGPWLKDRWAWRRVPGPFAPPLLGNLAPISQLGLHNYMLQCKQRYGNVFRIHVGTQPMLVVADPELARRIHYRNPNRTLRAQLRVGDEEDDIGRQGLVAARDEAWRTLRLAWQPAFQSGSLEGYAALMDSSAAALAARLRELGEGGRPVEVWRELGRMTLAVVGSTAYGADFHTLDSGSEAAAEGAALMQACQTVFATSSISGGSIYILLNALLPLPRLVGWAARTLPDARLRELTHARRVITSVSTKLIASWHKAHPVALTADARGAATGAASAPAAPEAAPVVETIAATVAAPAPGAAPGAADAAPARDQAPAGAVCAGGAKAAAPAGAQRRAGLGVAPGSFMGLMLGARSRADGTHLSDKAICAQANTFTLAGYETTANTLAFCLYGIAAHPRVQERLLAEVDAFGRDRAVTYADLDRFPYAEAVVREALRLYPPATMINRELKADGFEVMPHVRVPAGTALLTFVYGYQRDPQHWPQPEAFAPERWLPEGAALAARTPDAWTPFGAGARMCIGWRFALQEAKIALARLYQHQTYELEPGQVPLALQQNITLSPRNGVVVRVVPRAAMRAEAHAAAAAGGGADVAAFVHAAPSKGVCAAYEASTLSYAEQAEALRGCADLAVISRPHAKPSLAALLRNDAASPVPGSSVVTAKVQRPLLAVQPATLSREAADAQQRFAFFWRKVGFVLVHGFSLTVFWHFTWQRLALALLVWYIQISWGINAGYHRLLAHRSYKVPRVLEYFLSYCALSSLQGGPLEYHHKHTDTPLDLHSPYEGFWHAHCAWLFDAADTERPYLDRANVKELAEQPFYRAMEATYVPQALARMALTWWLAGFPAFVWSMTVPIMLGWHSTFLVNSACHLWGAQHYDSGDLSRNNLLVALIDFGEGNHNTHHTFAWSARHGLEWWQPDATWLLIRTLQRLGLAWDVQLPTEKQKAARRKADTKQMVW